MDDVTWPAAMVFLGIVALVIFLVGGSMSMVLELRKTRLVAAQEDQLRQLVGRYEKLSETSLDAQQRTASDVAELRSRAAAIEQLLRTVE